MGVKQESYVKWNVELEYGKETGKVDLYSQEQWEAYAEDWVPPDSEMFSAFTVAELGEMLPEPFDDGSSIIPPSRIKGVWQGCFLYSTHDADDNDGWASEDFEATTEADARAKMLIYLLENKLVKL